MAFKTVCSRIKLNKDIKYYITKHELTSPCASCHFQMKFSFVLSNLVNKQYPDSLRCTSAQTFFMT